MHLFNLVRFQVKFASLRLLQEEHLIKQEIFLLERLILFLVVKVFKLDTLTDQALFILF